MIVRGSNEHMLCRADPFPVRKNAIRDLCIGACRRPEPSRELNINLVKLSNFSAKEDFMSQETLPAKSSIIVAVWHGNSPPEVGVLHMYNFGLKETRLRAYCEAYFSARGLSQP